MKSIVINIDFNKSNIYNICNNIYFIAISWLIAAIYIVLRSFSYGYLRIVMAPGFGKYSRKLALGPKNAFSRTKFPAPLPVFLT